MRTAFPPHTWSLLAELRGYLEALIVALLVTTFVFTTVGVAGSSMEPTLYGGSGRMPQAMFVGDRLLIPKYETWLRRLGVLPGYERGMIVIVRELADSPLRGARRAFVVKRVIGTPGDTVAIDDGRVSVNGHPLDEDFITAGHISLGHDDMAPLTLGPGKYFIMGDNRTASGDSRIYGPVPFRAIAGRAAAVILPPRRHGDWYWRPLRVPESYRAIEPAPL